VTTLPHLLPRFEHFPTMPHNRLHSRDATRTDLGTDRGYASRYERLRHQPIGPNCKRLGHRVQLRVTVLRTLIPYLLWVASATIALPTANAYVMTQTYTASYLVTSPNNQLIAFGSSHFGAALTPPPTGSFVQVSSQVYFRCALQSDLKTQCWAVPNDP